MELAIGSHLRVVQIKFFSPVHVQGEKQGKDLDLPGHTEIN